MTIRETLPPAPKTDDERKRWEEQLTIYLERKRKYQVYIISTLTDGATPSVSGGSVFLTGGTTTVTDFDDGVEGQQITILSEHAITITDGTNIFLSGSANFVMASTDTLTLIQKNDSKWYEVGRSDNT